MNVECLIICGQGVVWPASAQMSFCEENVKTRFLHLLVCRESAPARKINCVFNVNNVWSSLSSAHTDFRVLHFTRIILFYWGGNGSVSNDTRTLGEWRFTILLDPGRARVREVLTMTWRLQYYTITWAQYTTQPAQYNYQLFKCQFISSQDQRWSNQRVGGIQIHDWEIQDWAGS